MLKQQSISLKRRDVVRLLLSNRKDMLVVSGLGSATYDCAAAGDHPLNFYLWGAMGCASTVGLGLALAQPKRRVLVVTGDGEMLMGLGSLATIGVQRPSNLSIAVIDNERYGETGMQPTHTASGVDLAGMAAAAGFPIALTARDGDSLKGVIAAISEGLGPIFCVVKVAADREPFVLPPRDGAYLKNRFREALMGRQAFA